MRAASSCEVPSALPGVPVPPTGHLPVVPRTERYGLVWVCLDEPVAGIPEIVQDGDPTFRRINNPVEAWTTSATRLTDNFMDITHFPFVHTATFGRAQDTVVPRFEVEALDDGWCGYAYEVDVNNPASAQTISGQTQAVLHRRMSSGFTLPFAVRSTIHYETDLQHILLLLTTPIDDVNCYFTFVVWRNDDFSVSAEEVIAFDRMIGAEDKKMLEQIPRCAAAHADRCRERPVRQGQRRVAPPVRHPPRPPLAGRRQVPARAATTGAKASTSFWPTIT